MIPIPPMCRPDEVRLLLNPGFRPGPYGARQKAVMDEASFVAAMHAITAWPGYAPSPLRQLDGLARAMGVAAVHYKDESERFGLASFKALGGAYAVQRQVERHGSDITVACATDGNHGRSVAWGAQRAGCRCVIYIHQHVSEGRKAAIEAHGAEVRRVPGGYDESVRQAAADAAKNGWIVVSDTSYPGYMAIPKDVMQGYGLMAEEAIGQLGGERPTHVFIQGGVGGLAAAVCFRFWQRMGPQRPRLVVAEPNLAACLFESAKAGRPTAVAIGEETVMAGLSCGEPSLLAWEILEEGAFAWMTVPDSTAIGTMRLLAAGVDGDMPVVAGESAVCGLGAAIAALHQPAMAKALELGPQSRIVVFGSEGATDLELYEKIVGRSAEAVKGGLSARGLVP